MDKGVLRRADPGAAARCFVGPLIAYILTREIFKQADADQLSAETMLATTVTMLLEGLALP